MKDLIPFDKRYDFGFLEERNEIGEHPVSHHYLKLDDLSINILISKKWILWGYEFFKQMKNELDTLNEKEINNIISNSIQKLSNIEEKEKILLIDDHIILNDLDFQKILDTVYINPEYGNIFNENTKIHIKLKININEFLIISNTLWPTFIEKIDNNS